MWNRSYFSYLITSDTYILKNQIDKSFRMLLTHPSSVVSFEVSFDHFRTNLNTNPKALELKSNYLELNQTCKQNMKGCKALHHKYKISEIAGKTEQMLRNEHT